MQSQPKSILGALLASALALTLGACGGSGSSTPAAIPGFGVSSHAIAGEKLPASYTCDGQDISPPLEWGTVPANVKQLALFVVGFTRSPETGKYKVSVEWALAGVNPALHKLAAGEVPPGAFAGFTKGRTQQYSVCPPKGTSVHYQVELYGVPPAVKVSPGFSDGALLNSLTIPSGKTRALIHGGFPADYTRE
jgi:phosphatidylethanolamine-binding protein (PEBP) family uncharacterized protein